jgi:hypothetical protein
MAALRRPATNDPARREQVMPFKFSVGQAVEYTPIGEKKAGLYKIVRQMPEEEQAADLRYRIKSDAEAYERNVLECHLSPDASEETNMPRSTPPLLGSRLT